MDTDTSKLEPTAPDPATQPDPESDQGAEQAPGIDLSQKVKLDDGKEIPISDLVSSYRKAEDLERYREHARRMVTNDGTIDEGYIEAARTIMNDAGYDEAQIEDWIQQQQAMVEEAQRQYEEPNFMADSNTDTSPETSGGNEALLKRIEQLENQLLQNQQNTEQVSVQMLERQLTSAIDTAQKSTHVKGLMESLDNLGGDSEARKEFFRNEIKNKTLDRIKRKKQAGGRFDPSWFEIESEKAAEEVAQNLRTVIGDPNLLRKAPETDAGQDILMPKGPVKEPNLPRTADISDRISEAQRFTSEKLLEGLRIGGDSKA